MGQVIFVSSLESKKEQTLFASYLAVFLAEQRKTALVDFAQQTHLLETLIAKRYHFNLKNNQNLAVPTYFSYHKNLLNEIKNNFDFIVLDGGLSVLLPQADIVVTLFSSKKNAEDLVRKESALSEMFWRAKKERATHQKNAFKHILVACAELEKETMTALEKAQSFMGFRVAPMWKINQAYQKFFETGVSVLDKNLPCFQKELNEADFWARRNLKEIFEAIFSAR